ncbi:uncharacterized protein N7479_009111, partial [Penicillium vulpinum]|uniref:uncharacterized protein n=1 Tax=Penicillium vulpinum TaxID=29845 RepID=UPI002546A6A1
VKIPNRARNRIVIEIGINYPRRANKAKKEKLREISRNSKKTSEGVPNIRLREVKEGKLYRSENKLVPERYLFPNKLKPSRDINTTPSDKRSGTDSILNRIDRDPRIEGSLILLLYTFINELDITLYPREEYYPNRIARDDIEIEREISAINSKLRVSYFRSGVNNPDLGSNRRKAISRGPRDNPPKRGYFTIETRRKRLGGYFSRRNCLGVTTTGSIYKTTLKTRIATDSISTLYRIVNRFYYRIILIDLERKDNTAELAELFY